MEEKKTGFSSRLGFVLAAAGSAVGLGNIWRFPYLAAKYGGGIFLLVYLILTVTFGFSLLLTEVTIGRKTGKSVLGAYTDVNRKFTPLGWIAGAVPVIIFPYYCVIGGWVIKYLTIYITGNGTTAASDSFFGNFIGQAGQPFLFLGIYLVINAVVVMFGVRKGVEKVSTYLMPVLVVMTIGISVYVLTIDGALEGFLYYIKPDISKFSIKTVIAAMGQLFYSMSIAMGIMVTYGSYMRKEDNLEKSVRHIELFDTGIAFLSGMMIVPAVYAISGGDESKIDKGPGLMFQTLPQVFEKMPGGKIIGAVFFMLVFLAALTSSISLMETIVSMITEKTKIKRIPACVMILAFGLGVGALSVLGYSTWSDFTIFGKQILDFFDFISNNIMMPVVALMTCILVGYVVKTKYIEDEVQLTSDFKSKKMYRAMIKYIAPVFMLVILVSSLVLDL